MASSKANQKKIKKACNALKHLGISAKTVRLALKGLLEAYENNWTYIEEDSYRVLIEAIFEPEEPMVLDKPKLRFDNEKPMVLDKPKLRFDNEEPMVLDKPKLRFDNEKPMVLDKPKLRFDNEEPMVLDKPKLRFDNEEPMVLDKPKLRFDNEEPMVLDKPKLRFDNEELDFNLLDEPDEEEIEPLRKRPRRQNRSSSPAGSSVPCSSNYASEMQQMVEPDFGAMDGLEPAKPEVMHFYQRRVSNRIEKVQHDTLFGDSDDEENEAQSQDRPSSPAGSSVPCSSNYASENMDDKGNENEDEDENVTPCSSEIDIVSSSNGEVKLALSICKPLHGFRIPSLDAVMKQVEEKYRENFRGLGVEFTLSELLKEICDCFVEQGNVSDGNNQSLVQTFENFMEAEKQCGQLSLSTTPSDHTDAPVLIPRSVVSSPFTYVHVVNGVYSDVFSQTFRKQKTPVVDNLSGSTHLTLCLKDDSLQRGIQANLQVFMTSEGKGWGLRTLEDLPKGTFVCEHVGEIVSNTELFERNEQNTDEKHTYPVLLDANWSSKGFLKDIEALCLDATSFGNVARFINHRCKDANLVAIPVEVESPGHHYYHHVFFTARDVKAMEELTWDYGIDFDDDSYPVKAFNCKCGSSYCRQTKHKNEADMAYDKQLIATMK